MESINMIKSRAGILEDSTSLDSIPHSHASSTTSSQKRYSQSRFVWKNTWEYMIVALAFTCNPSGLWAFLDVKSEDYQNPNIYQFCIVYVFVGMPLVYMLVILGQYTQRGLLHLKYMCPIGHGNGYVCLIIIVIYISIYTIDIADSLMYFLTTLQENVQWMMCPKTGPIAMYCWSGTEDCNEQCLSTTVHLSAYWYWNHTYMDTVSVAANNKMELIMPSLPRMISIAFSVALVWFIVVFVSKNFQRKLVQWLFYVSFSFLIGLLCCIGGLPGSADGLRYMFAVKDLSSFYSIRAWSHAVSVIVNNLCLGRACQMIFGTFMPSMNYSGIRTLIHVLTNMFVNILLCMLSYMSIGAVTHKAKLKFKDYMLVLHNADFPEMDLIVIPQSIGFKYAPQFWNLIYFGMQICFLLSNQILLQGIFVKCISDSFQNLKRYHKYIHSALSLFTGLLSISFISKSLFMFHNALSQVIMLYMELIVIASMSLVILWIYGIKRLSDDLHFITGQQPTKFWKIFWIMTPAILVISSFTVNLYPHLHRYLLVIQQLIFYFVSTLPIPILGCIEIFKYLKKRNLVGLFQPEEIWGPPDPEERIMRHVFNPRKEIKSRRRTETCQHKCLLGSKVLKKIVQEEAKARSGKTMSVLGVLSENEIV